MTNVPHWSDILTAAARGNLTRHKEGGHWQFRMNGKEVRRKTVFELMRSGYLEPSGAGPPVNYWQDITVTVKGREALRNSRFSGGE